MSAGARNRAVLPVFSARVEGMRLRRHLLGKVARQDHVRAGQEARRRVRYFLQDHPVSARKGLSHRVQSDRYGCCRGLRGHAQQVYISPHSFTLFFFAQSYH